MILEHIIVKQVISLVLLLAIVFIYGKLVCRKSVSILKRIFLFLLAIGQFEKRERPTVIAEGHRDAVLDCLYKNANTGDVNRQVSYSNNLFFAFLAKLCLV
jgi:hypothetical protein